MRYKKEYATLEFDEKGNNYIQFLKLDVGGWNLGIEYSKNRDYRYLEISLLKFSITLGLIRWKRE